MESLGVTVYIDDILVTGRTDDEHMHKCGPQATPRVWYSTQERKVLVHATVGEVSGVSY